MDTTGWVTAEGRATRRIWRTTDGEYVPDGDARAAFLAYGQGAEISPVDLAPLRELKDGPTAQVTEKQADEPPNKARLPQANKAR